MSRAGEADALGDCEAFSEAQQADFQARVDAFLLLTGSLTPFVPDLVAEFGAAPVMAPLLALPENRFKQIGELSAWVAGQPDAVLAGVVAGMAAAGYHPLSLLSACSETEDHLPELRRRLRFPLDAGWAVRYGVPHMPLGPLPEGLVVRGNLILGRGSLERDTLPGRLAVEDHLVLDGWQGRALPRDLWVGRSLAARRGNLRTIPAGFSLFDWSQWAGGCRRLGLEEPEIPSSQDYPWNPVMVELEELPWLRRLPRPRAPHLQVLVKDCPGFQTKAWGWELGSLGLEGAFPRLKALKGFRCQRLDLDGLSALEEVRGRFLPGERNAGFLRDLPALKTVAFRGPEVELHVRDCDALVRLEVRNRTCELDLVDLPSLRTFEFPRGGRLRGTIIRCPRLRTMPLEVGPGSWAELHQMVRLRVGDAPWVRSFASSAPDTARVPPHRGLPAAQLEVLLQRRLQSAKKDLRRLHAAFHQGWREAPNPFAKLRIAKTAYRLGLRGTAIRDAMQDEGYCPLSMLLALGVHGSEDKLRKAVTDLSFPGLEWVLEAMDFTWDPFPGIPSSDPGFKRWENLKVPGDVLWGCSHFPESLPKGFEVEGGLTLHGCEGLRTLPPGLILNGDLILENLPDLEALPEDLIVEGKIRITGCPHLEAAAPPPVSL